MNCNEHKEIYKKNGYTYRPYRRGHNRCKICGLELHTHLGERWQERLIEAIYKTTLFHLWNPLQKSSLK